MTPPPSANPENVPAGFQFAGVACGIKKSGKSDLALITTDRPVVAAGVYTQNQIVASPVVRCRDRTPSSSIRAVVANSGNANACTGRQGERDADEMIARVADHIGCDAADVLVMSTGVIGQLLPMDRVREGIDQAVASRSTGAQAFDAAARAILTTDQDRKVAFRSLDLGGVIRIAAMAKGAGMIAPNMATMLAVICTDASLKTEDAQRLISEAAAISFNRASVDGHTSTNDTLLLLASGDGPPLAGSDLERFAAAINEVSIALAKELVGDGEGATHILSLRIRGAEDDAAAETIARTVAASPLVKTAITGADPNWGRIVSAAGYAAARIEPQKTSLRICGYLLYERGVPLQFDAAAVSQQMKEQNEVEIDLVVGDGPGSANFWASDLTEYYVRFNSEYTT